MKKTDYINLGARDVVITGTIKSTVDIAVAATVIGNIECTKKVLIDDQALISGNVNASDVTVVNGSIVGDVTCENSVTIYKGGSIEGTINCKTVVIDEGAFFEGECIMTADSAKNTSTEDK